MIPRECVGPDADGREVAEGRLPHDFEDDRVDSRPRSTPGPAGQPDDPGFPDGSDDGSARSLDDVAPRTATPPIPAADWPGSSPSAQPESFGSAPAMQQGPRDGGDRLRRSGADRQVPGGRAAGWRRPGAGLPRDASRAGQGARPEAGTAADRGTSGGRDLGRGGAAAGGLARRGAAPGPLRPSQPGPGRRPGRPRRPAVRGHGVRPGPDAAAVRPAAPAGPARGRPADRRAGGGRRLPARPGDRPPGHQAPQRPDRRAGPAPADRLRPGATGNTPGRATRAIGPAGRPTT